MPWLHRDDLEDESAWFRLDTEATVGSGSDCDLTLDSPGVSRRHCRIENKGGRWRVVDLASEGGTRVRGTDVSQLILADGDVIEVGEASLRFHRSRPRPSDVSDATEKMESARRGRRAVSPWLLGAAALALVGAIYKGTSGKEAAPSTVGASRGDSVAAASADEASRAGDEIADSVRRDAPSPHDPETRALRSRIQPLEESRNWGEAVRLVAMASEHSPLNLDLLELEVDLRAKAARELERLERHWKTLGRTGAWERVRQDAQREEQRFAGTGLEARIQDWASLAALPPRRSSSSDKAPKTASREDAAGSRTRLSPTAEGAAVTRAEALVSARRWREAADIFGQLAKDTRDETKRRLWEGRAHILEAMGDLKARVIVDVNEEKRRGVTLRIGTLAARCVAADEDLVQIKLGRGEEEWAWKDIPADRLLALFDWASVSPEERLQFALAAHHLGDAERAIAALGEAARDSASKRQADQLFARWTGVARPAGGFVLLDGRLMTPEDAEARRLLSQARVLARKASIATDDRFKEICFELRAMGTPARKVLDDIVKTRFEQKLEQARKLKVFKNIAAARAKVFDELEARRKAALALIRDSVRYPYPYGPDQKEVQAEVDALVQRVRDVYEHPASYLEGELKSLAAAHESLKALRGLALGGGDAAIDPGRLLDELDRALDVTHHGLRPSAQKSAADVLQFNAEIVSSITDDERELHRLTNLYRMMMGLRPVKIDEALVRAARKHSQEMMDLHYFAHASPVKEHRTPSMRAAQEGWGGGVSENIARGAPTPAGALRGWLHSSGHHRNIVGAGWTHLGCGKAKGGAFWTQNFGKGSSSALSKEKKAPESGAPRH